MRRRGVELSLNLVVLVVLALIVVSVVIYLVVKNTRDADNSLNSCTGYGGHCQRAPCPAGETGSAFFTKECAEEEICCVRTSSDER